MRLAGVAQHLQAHILCSQSHTGEIHMRSDVFVAYVVQRIAIAVVRLVAHQGTHMALLMEVLGFWKAIVDEEHGTPLESLAHAAHKGFSLRMNFRQKVMLTFNVNGWSFLRRTVLPCENIVDVIPHDTTLVPHTRRPLQKSHRHGVQDLVAHHHGVDVCG